MAILYAVEDKAPRRASTQSIASEHVTAARIYLGEYR